MHTLKLVAVSAGLGSPSSTRLLTDRLLQAARYRLAEQEYAVDVQVVELRDLAVDVLFVGCDGMSPERGFSTPYTAEVAIKQAMMAAARRVVMMFDHSKVGNDQLYRFASLDQVDLIITGVEVNEAVAAAMEAQGPRVIRV